MTLIECVKMLIKMEGVREHQIARWRGKTQSSVHQVLSNGDIKANVAVDILELMGYEVIVREKKQGTRRNDEILITHESEEINLDRLAMIKEEEQKRRAKERHYAEIDMQLSRFEEDGMRVEDLKRFFNKQYAWVNEHFGGYFYGKRIPVREVSRIIREKNL